MIFGKIGSCKGRIYITSLFEMFRERIERREIAEEKEIMVCGREWKGEAKIYMGARNIIA